MDAMAFGKGRAPAPVGRWGQWVSRVVVILDQILAVADPSEVLGGQIGLGLGENQVAEICHQNFHEWKESCHRASLHDCGVEPFASFLKQQS